MLSTQLGVSIALVLVVTALQFGSDNLTYRCPTTSMMPTMGAGDRFAAIRDPYRNQPPERGDVVVFIMPEGVPENFEGLSVKRVIGLPGELIALVDYRAVINGKPLDEDYVAIPDVRSRPKNGGAAPGDVSEQLVPAGQCYVLGDNRGNSLDSRYFGPIPISTITAKGTTITQSSDSSRVGRKLRPRP
jgi:signal peptidase I